jgi:lipopolysaccharide/colanic/teichoic acid biosynthesis glycosyltransferase
MRRRVGLGCKRLVDVAGAVIGLIVLSPILAAVALASLRAQGRPILFRHERPGRAGKPFILVKFRTMRALRPGEPPYHSDDQRVTRLGRFLRATSIDELPELWNVVRGEMSLVGPRPLLTEYLPVYTPEEARRHDMRPGVTSWAAVNGRHVLKFHERLALDVWYVDQWSLKLDAKILLMTVEQVFRRTDVSTTQDIAEIGFPLRVGDPQTNDDRADDSEPPA